MSYMDVFPRRNLNPDAEPWGRKVDETIRQLGRSVDSLQMGSLSENRASAGQFGVLGRQIDAIAAQQTELAQRTTIVQPLESLTVRSTPASSGGLTTWGTGTRSFSLPAPGGGARYVDVFVSGDLTSATKNANYLPSVYVTLRVGSSALATEVYQVPHASAPGQFPPSWQGRFRVNGDFSSGTGNTAMSIVVSVPSTGGNGWMEVTLSGIRATARYGPLV